ncbi:hypothetical protein [Sphingopyxis terrae]|uniref:hypothetical protein n=1 Tax=Sphingopyxis terrae TaxID=33052 RepID=UPI003636FD99
MRTSRGWRVAAAAAVSINNSGRSASSRSSPALNNPRVSSSDKDRNRDLAASGVIGECCFQNGGLESRK